MAWEKTAMRREMAARLELTGVYTDAEIANSVGLSPSGYAQMKMQPEYQAIRMRIKEGILEFADDSLGDNILAMQKKVRDNVPAALNTIIDAVQQRRDLKLAVAASEKLIEIDGRMSPVKRVGLPTAEQGGIGTSEDAAVVAGMVAAISALEEKKEKGLVTLDGETIQ